MRFPRLIRVRVSHHHFHHDPEVAREVRDLKHRMERFFMATQETLDRLSADVQANKDAADRATQALRDFAATVADLTQKLQDAIGSNDEAAVSAAADGIEAATKEINDQLTPPAPPVEEPPTEPPAT